MSTPPTGGMDRASLRSVRNEELDAAAGLAHVHLDRLLVREELAEVSQDEAPGPGSFMEVLLPREGKWFLTADAAEDVVAHGASLRPLVRSTGSARYHPRS